MFLEQFLALKDLISRQIWPSKFRNNQGEISEEQL